MSNGSMNPFTDCTSCKPQAFLKRHFKKCALFLNVTSDTLIEANLGPKLLLESK